MRRLKALSVDWDYFFPSLAQFDWGHCEKPIFLELIWSMRANGRSVLTGEYAVDIANPNQQLLDSFWSSVVDFNYQTSFLILTDSHRDLYSIMDSLCAEFDVVNFDQHHDLSYTGNEAELSVDCSNWAGMGLKEGIISSYELWYPEWRKSESEGHSLSHIPVYYGLPSSPRNFDVIFICRSSAWTPSWADDRWLNFISSIEFKNPRVWKNRTFCEFILSQRYPNLDEAVRLKEEFEEQLNELRLRNSIMSQAKSA